MHLPPLLGVEREHVQRRAEKGCWRAEVLSSSISKHGMRNLLFAGFSADIHSILVLMDVPLEYGAYGIMRQTRSVSILVLMDVPLEFFANPSWNANIPVSILVLMDVPLES